MTDTTAPTTTLQLPNLSAEQWRTILSTFASKTDIPAGQIASSENDPCPARTKLVSRIASDQGLDELPEDDPQVTETLRRFIDMTEAQAMTAIFVNNVFWETGEALWQSAADPVA